MNYSDAEHVQVRCLERIRKITKGKSIPFFKQDRRRNETMTGMNPAFMSVFLCFSAVENEIRRLLEHPGFQPA